MTLRLLSISPLKPDNTPPATSAKVPLVPRDNVPLPLNVPARLIIAELVPTVSAAGLLPKGKLQPLFIVKVTALLDLAITTELNVAVPQVAIAAPPVNVSVPKLASKVGLPDIEKLPESDQFPDVALKLPAVKEKLAVDNVCEPLSKVPAACENALVTVKDLAKVIVPV